MNLEKARITTGGASPSIRKPAGTLSTAAIFFAISCLVLFLGMSRNPGTYDEGIFLTGAMRMAAGQIPHRDFYVNYGPAAYYSFTLLFKIFGASVLSERLLSIFFEASTVAVVFIIVSRDCSRSVACATAVAILLWIDRSSITGPTAILPVGLLNLIATVLILRTFSHGTQWKSLAAAGALAGANFLYRYDTGTALFGIEIILLAIAALLQKKPPLERLKLFLIHAGFCLVGFLLITLPPVLYFLSMSSIQPFIHDIIVYPSRYYNRARGLPFPKPNLHSLAQLGVYLPVLALAMGGYALAITGPFSNWRAHRTHSENPPNTQNRLDGTGGKAFLLVFGLISFVMYFKGFVRPGLGSMYLSLIPAILIMAVLYVNRRSFPSFASIAIVCLGWFTLLLPALSLAHDAVRIMTQRNGTGPVWSTLLFPNHPQTGPQATWCRVPNPVTRGFCFPLDNGRINSIAFIDVHTRPDQTLYVGLDRHDKVFANDNILYFASQRLPATKWSDFDPLLQNSLPIQMEMTKELDRNAPPYIILDSEYTNMDEPNDSSKSSGVSLLDDYLRSKYRYVEKFDEMTIWQRIP